MKRGDVLRTSREVIPIHFDDKTRIARGHGAVQTKVGTLVSDDRHVILPEFRFVVGNQFLSLVPGKLLRDHLHETVVVPRRVLSETLYQTQQVFRFGNLVGAGEEGRFFAARGRVASEVLEHQLDFVEGRVVLFQQTIDSHHHDGETLGDV